MYYVLERTGVEWRVRFFSGHSVSNRSRVYSGHNSSNLLANFGSLDSAKKFGKKTDAEAARDLLDRETGVYTMVSHIDDFGV